MRLAGIPLFFQGLLFFSPDGSSTKQGQIRKINRGGDYFLSNEHLIMVNLRVPNTSLL